MFSFKPGDRIVFIGSGLASPGTLLSKDALNKWRIKWDDGLPVNVHAFSEDHLLLLVCEQGS